MAARLGEDGNRQALAHFVTTTRGIRRMSVPASPKADPAKVARRRPCGIPAEVGHVEKWQLALDMIDEARSWGIGH